MRSEAGEMADTETVRGEEEVMILKERRPSVIYPEQVVLEKGERRRGILTILGGFIVCLSFGSGMV